MQTREESQPGFMMTSRDWIGLATVIAFAAGLRLLFYTGFFGSDEVTYVQTAHGIVSGDWQASDYIGATRYGMNLPMALAIYLFGLSPVSANLWPFLTSIGEVAVIFAIAHRLWGSRVAQLSAALLALLPLHVHFAGRMMADAPLAFFLSLSVLLVLRAGQFNTAATYFAAGLAWGGSFWVKESVGILYLPVFLLLTLYISRLNRVWLWTLVGAASAVLLNCALMAFVADNPLHIFSVMKNATLRVTGMSLETAPSYYLRYLLLDIRHTLFLGHLAIAGVGLYLCNIFLGKPSLSNTRFVILWASLMVGMFSFAVVSFSPVKMIMKQTNYMLIFAGPLVLLAGWFMAALPKRIFVALGLLTIAGSTALAALEQQAITVFTANSKAAYAFLRDRPSVFLIATTNNERAVYFYSMFDEHLGLRERIMSLAELTDSREAGESTLAQSKTAGKDIYGLLDLQNVTWGIKRSRIQQLKDVPSCWMPTGVLEPAALGHGRWVSKALVAATSLLPESARVRLAPTLQSVSAPAPAHLFRIDASCLNSTMQ